jgi:hypothetical protein
MEGVEEDDEARARATASTVFLCDAAHGNTTEGHLDANVCMFIGKAHGSDLHPTGYWCGNDVYTQLNHAITVFEILHPGCKGLFLFDSSTGHSKMAEDALLAQNMNSGPGGKHVSKQRGLCGPAAMALSTSSRPCLLRATVSCSTQRTFGRRLWTAPSPSASRWK